MPDAAAIIVADLRHSVELLVGLDDPAATRTAGVLTRWLAGEAFDTAAGLIPGWRSHLRLSARDRALAALVEIQIEMSADSLAAWIEAGIERVSASSSGVRPDGADGYLDDLARAECVLSRRQWRRLIVGHRAR